MTAEFGLAVVEMVAGLGIAAAAGGIAAALCAIALEWMGN